MKPSLFIVSSVEGLVVADNIKLKLEHHFNIDTWNEGVFGIGSTTIDDLLNKLSSSDFGVFVFTPDDNSTIRKVQHSVVRDNVLYELGLYTGKLGRKNTFIVVPDNLSEDFHLPSDLIGVNLGKYDAGKMKSNPESAVSTFCTRIRNQVFNHSNYPLSGKWRFAWEAKSSSNYEGEIFEEVDVFYYENVLKFIHSINSNEKYVITGELNGRYLTGSFRNLNKVGYDGAFQMHLNGQGNVFKGQYIGWQNDGGIGNGPCTLTKL